ncbi:MAG: alpha-amylase family glycosyl hydrolase [Bacteroidales bacterium]|nr:alpha-amylase family glycosyl hydrolase [Bacteroidales bacterium]
MTEKIIIYQTFPRIFGNKNPNNIFNGNITENGCGKMKDYSTKALKSIKELGCNYIWYTGIIQHATKTDYSKYGIPKNNKYVVKGEAGSPYAISDYYSVDPDLATNPVKRMEEFAALVERTHKESLKVIIDFVPNHVARQYNSQIKPLNVKDLGETDDDSKAFSPSNNFYYIPNSGFAPLIDLGSGDEQYVEMPAKATGNDCFHQYPSVNDWYETIKLNYGVDYSNGSKHFDPIPNTWIKMFDILHYWASMGIDGFRCDMAHMVPIEFWHWCIAKIKKDFPKIIFIAEIYQPSLYRDYIFNGGFDYLYDKVGLYDTLREIVEGKAPASNITYQWQNLEGIQKNMVNFLENHDEQRIASQMFCADPFKAFPALIVSALMNTNPFMIYFGQELGEEGMNNEGFSGKDGRTSIFDYTSLETIRSWNNNGKWDDSNLSQKECEIREFYKKILTLANKEKAFKEGTFFDLMYANYQNENFDTNKQYAFIRKFEDDLIIVIANFSSNNEHISLNIPNHAFDFLNIPTGSADAVNLITKEKYQLILSYNRPLNVEIKGYNGLLLKFKLAKK